MKTFVAVLILSYISCCSVLSAQEANTLTITSPADLAGDYIVAQPTSWGQKVDSFSGTVILVDDGFGVVTDACQPVSSDLTGLIAIIDKGECDQTEQVLNVQNSNAVAAIICNSIRSDSPYQIRSQSVPNIPNDGKGSEVNIPVFAISDKNCIELKLGQETGAKELSFNYSCKNIIRDKVIWGDQPGQGDFSNGLGEWTVVSDRDTSWYWSDNRIIKGRYTTESQAVEGTACNGYMVFPSDFYDNAGNYLVPNDPSSGPNFGAGPCSNDGLKGEFCSGSLFSPIIDLSGDSISGLFCSFYHDWGYYFGGSTSLIVSYDAGMSWPDTTHITLGDRAETLNSEVNKIDDCVLQTVKVNGRGEGFYTIPLSNYNGQTSIQLQFRHQGGYYHATIDDVVLINDAYVDLELLRSFVARAQAAAMPIEQANAVPLHIELFNKGNLQAIEVSVAAEVCRYPLK